MRKFVIKNRQKRKYTRKSEEISSFSFSKTASSMIPLLVMLIAFMSTMIISMPVRDALTNISFTFVLPQFSLTNPLNFFQTAAIDISQFGIFVWTILQAFTQTLSHSFMMTETKATHGTFSLINFLILCGNSIWSGGIFLLQELLKQLSLFGKFFNFIVSAGWGMVRVSISFTVNAAITTAQFISVITQIVLRLTTIAFIYIFQIASFVTFSVIHFLVFITQTTFALIVSTINAIGAFIANVFLAIVHTLEIPFKVVYAFWIQIKPYIDFFDKHVQMSESDFSNMFNSFSKIGSLMSSQK